MRNKGIWNKTQRKLYKATTKFCGLSRQVVFHATDNKHDFVKTVPGKWQNSCVLVGLLGLIMQVPLYKNFLNNLKMLSAKHQLFCSGLSVFQWRGKYSLMTTLNYLHHKNIQLNAVITQSNIDITWIITGTEAAVRQNINQMLHPQNTSHTSP